MASLIDKILNKCLEETNFLLGYIRRWFIRTQKFTIISNNCWGGKVYRYFNLPYNSPTVGLYFYAKDYLKFCSRFEYYISQELRFIDYRQSKHKDDLISKKETDVIIGVVDDVEIIFLHYNSVSEALNKWERRKKRIDFNNLYFKFSEQNGCTVDDLISYSNLPLPNKVIFTTKDYGLPNQVVFKNSLGCKETIDETLRFKYVSPIKYINKGY